MTPEAVLEATVALAREAIGASSEAAVGDAILRIAGALIGADQGALGLVRDTEVVTVAALMPPRQPAEVRPTGWSRPRVVLGRTSSNSLSPGPKSQCTCSAGALGSHFPVGFGVAGWVAATGRPAEIQDVRQDKRYVPLPYPEVRSFVGVPLQTRGDMLGVLSLAAWRPGAFKAGTAEALAPFAEAAALFLRRTAEEEHRQLRLETLEHAAREGLAESLHELKAPLHAAAGFLDLVASEQTGPLNELQKDFLETARGECARLKEALSSLVEVSASTAQRTLSGVVDPAELIEEAVIRTRGQAIERSVAIRAEADPGAKTVVADRAAILQVLANFLQNALRLAPAESEIVVGTRSDGGWTEFFVLDAGPGVPEEQLETIFERFKQGRAATREVGTVGLGLAISRRIIEEHNGRIWAENRTDARGARFCFALPAVN